MKKNFWIVSVLVVTGLLVSSCGINVSFDAKYIGENGKAMSWICLDGKTVEFDHRVASAAAELKCSSTIVENTDPCENDTDKEDPCLIKAGNLGFPDDLATYVCDGSYGQGGIGTLPSGTEVEFGTIIFDNATTAWILRDFVVPDIASYAYEYAGTEKSIFDAQVFYDKECFDSEGERGVPCNICFDTVSAGCKLDIELTN